MAIKYYLIDKIELMKEWDFVKNHELNPAELVIGSNKNAYWVCSLCDNEWSTSIYHRAIQNSGCRNCSSKRRLKFKVEDSIYKTHPEISKNWDYDHNGQVPSLSLNLDPSGAVLRNYDPFGKPRNSDGSLKAESKLEDFDTTTTRRGFTDHEHLDEIELIHMNGRVYDYNLGRFML
jgi:hypothetical protein